MNVYSSKKSSSHSETVSLLYFGAFTLSLLLSGCQKSSDQYQVITEEISQPAEKRTDTEVGDDSVKEDDQQRTANSTSSENPKSPDDNSKVSNKSEKNKTPDKDANSEAENDPDVAASPPKVEMTKEGPAESETTEESTTERVQNFINVQEEIARQERLKKLGLDQSAEPAEPREPKLLVKEREFSKERESDAWRVSYDDLDLLKILNMEPVPLNAVDYLPDWLTQLEGEKIILRGWMYPPDRAEGIKGFIFVRDNQVCCFGPNAKAYDKLTVRLQSGTETNFIQGRPFDVIGTFKIDPWIEDERDPKTGEFIEKIGMLYHLEDARIVVGK